MLQRTQMLQRTMLQRMNAKRTVFIKVRMLQRTQMLQRTMLQRMNAEKEQFLSNNVTMLQRTHSTTNDATTNEC
jgi:hypothetical protein